MPRLEKLERLELSDNKIGFSGTGVAGISELYPNLRVLKLAGNHIKTLDELKPLADCKKLENLDISNNPVSQKQEDSNYVAKIREFLPNIEVIDGFNREGEEVVSEDDDDEDEDEEEEDDDDEDGEPDEEDDDDDDDEDEEDEEGEEEEGEDPTADKSTGKRIKSPKQVSEGKTSSGSKRAKTDA